MLAQQWKESGVRGQICQTVLLLSQTLAKLDLRVGNMGRGKYTLYLNFDDDFDEWHFDECME